jgi:hypothetical protein
MDDRTDLSDEDVLSEAAIRQLREKLREAIEIGWAEVILVVENGCLRWIRGPAPSEPVQK